MYFVCPTSEANRSSVLAAWSVETRLSVAGRVVRGSRRARLVRAFTAAGGGGLLEAVLRGQGRRLAADHVTARHRPARRRQAPRFRPVGGRRAYFRRGHGGCQQLHWEF